jgi:folate-binding protein YgfZ
MEAGGVEAVYHQLLERGLDESGHGGVINQNAIRLRAAGWHAYNIARIEAGTPMFNIDFGTSSLPAETGVMGQRVSFTKGCYLGQEVVARMNSLGHPKQTLVGLRVEAPSCPPGPPGARDAQPVSGSAVAVGAGAELTQVGTVTSSTRSPMLGDAVVCFAQMKWGNHEPGTKLMVDTDAGVLPATVQESLVFWRRGD